jgi:nucleoside-diphosphate-sugar epimerase
MIQSSTSEAPEHDHPNSLPRPQDNTGAMAIKTVAVVGANGTLGSQVVSGLVASGLFDVSVIQRASSSSKPSYPSSQVKVITVDDGFTHDALVKALQGQDSLILAFPLRDLDAHLRLVEAAAAVGVKHVMPADFGSVDAESAPAQELVKLYRSKLTVSRRVQKLAEENPNFTWTGIVCGHFFEWSLKEHLYRADLAKHTIDILDGGKHRASATTLTRVAEAVVRILKLHGDEAVRNKTLFIQSFCISQLQLVQALEKATGTKWTVNDYDSREFINERRAKADAGDFMANEDLVFAIGTLYADWTQRDEFAMDLLGFENEDYEKVVADVVNS